MTGDVTVADAWNATSHPRSISPPKLGWAPLFDPEYAVENLGGIRGIYPEGSPFAWLDRSPTAVTREKRGYIFSKVFSQLWLRLYEEAFPVSFGGLVVHANILGPNHPERCCSPFLRHFFPEKLIY